MLDDFGMIGKANDFDGDSNFFHHLANGSLAQAFACLDASAGERKESVRWCFCAASDKHAPIVTENRGARSECRAYRVTHTCWPPLM